MSGVVEENDLICMGGGNGGWQPPLEHTFFIFYFYLPPPNSTTLEMDKKLSIYFFKGSLHPCFPAWGSFSILAT